MEITYQTQADDLIALQKFHESKSAPRWFLLVIIVAVVVGIQAVAFFMPWRKSGFAPQIRFRAARDSQFRFAAISFDDAFSAAHLPRLLDFSVESHATFTSATTHPRQPRFFHSANDAA